MCKERDECKEDIEKTSEHVEKLKHKNEKLASGEHDDKLEKWQHRVKDLEEKNQKILTELNELYEVTKTIEIDSKSEKDLIEFQEKLEAVINYINMAISA
mmetsp:Transcript_32273/g.5825  ORF Transcript_32273/g.5825 Transcript_32273/m.5825 type:complete len:100 (-) Transcript_32273:65-364(-)